MRLSSAYIFRMLFSSEAKFPSLMTSAPMLPVRLLSSLLKSAVKFLRKLPLYATLEERIDEVKRPFGDMPSLRLVLSAMYSPGERNDSRPRVSWKLSPMSYFLPGFSTAFSPSSTLRLSSESSPFLFANFPPASP